MQYPVILTAEHEAGGFVAECPAIPGCVSEGDTVEQALANIREAIEACLAVMREHGDPIPKPADSLLATVEIGA
jgi:predicted RNase H-like HicB family nuclease